MNQDATWLGKIVRSVKPPKADAILKLVTFSYHHVTSQARAPAAKLIAELRSGICVPLATAVHTIAAHHALAMLQVVYEEPLFARRYGEIYKYIIICTIPSSVAIVPHLRKVLTIHLVIPKFGIDVIIIQWFVNLLYIGGTNGMQTISNKITNNTFKTRFLFIVIKERIFCI